MNLTRLAHARPFITRQLLRLPFFFSLPLSLFPFFFFLFDPERGLVIFLR